MEDLATQLEHLTDLSNLDLPGTVMSDDDIAVYEPPEFKEVISNPENRTSDVQNDYHAARDSNHFQDQILRIAMLKQLENASMCDLPRQMEVLATLSAQMTNNTKQKLEIHKQMRDATEETVKTVGDGTPTATTNVFVGSANDLLDHVGSRQEHLREQRDKSEVIEVVEDDKED